MLPLRHLLVVASALLVAACASPAQPLKERAPKWGLAVHGGAGTISREKLTPEKEAVLRAELEAALRKGHSVLASGGSSLDAVTAAVVVLEDSPHFNAGKGAVFTHDGKNELDAAVMDGPTLRAGSVAGLHRVKNPVLLARAVMERSKHVMMIGDGAETFAAEAGLELVDPSYFFTQDRWDALQRELEKERTGRPVGGDAKFGTVGAVALDPSGRLSAATSTGGMTNKRYGRVGDVPVIGAGTYADPRCAVSATGHGEFFIRHTVAHDLCARMKYQGATLKAAADAVVMEELVRAGGEGGVIAMDADGNYTLPFNTSGMYRGYIGADGVPHVAIFKDAPR